MARCMRRSRSASVPLLMVAVVALALGRSVLPNFLQPSNTVQKSRRAATLAVVGAALSVQPPDASAAVDFKTSRVWAGFYADPNHPGCKREIKVGDDISIEGTDGNPGCIQGGEVQTGFLLRAKWTPGSDTLIIDFSPKGGPKDLQGKWDENGILFPDGNKWTKIMGR
mmetsp:Transcript_130361/g.260037  ORF Transcript_130361/g.260037 Transcript_130361/m.260037 type:complete len:168 (+) Transcript_130361:86-589(+)